MTLEADRWDPTTVDGTDWVCAHIFYDHDQDSLLRDCVRPLVDTLSRDGLIQRWFYLRYWEGGPHVRVRFLPNDAGAADAIEARALEHIETYLAAHPSPDVVDRSKFATVATGLAGLEGRDGHSSEIYPNNSVQALTYEPENGDYGYGAALAAVEEHFEESSQLALSVVGTGISVDQRALLAFDLLVGVFALCDEVRDQWVQHGGPPLPFGSGPESDAVEGLYESQAEQLLGRAQRTWQQAHSEGGTDSRAYWLTSIRILRERLHKLEESGAFASNWADSPLAEPLNLHSTTHPSTSLVLLRCAHLVNNRLGLTLWQENQLRFLVGRVLSDLPEANQ